MIRSALAFATLSFLALGACGGVAPLFCDEDTPCTDPSRPFCDLNGDFPASDGIGRTCIPNPFDAGVDAGGDAGIPNGPLKQVATAGDLSCILTKTGEVKCWGDRLAIGYGAAVNEDIGDNETPDVVGFVPIGEPVKSISVGGVSGNNRTIACAITESNRVHCWGESDVSGWLGDQNVGEFVGDDETPAMAGPFAGVNTNAISTGISSSCFVSVQGAADVQCFGTDTIGAVIPTSVAAVDATTINVNGEVVAVTVGNRIACAIMNTGDIRCWGNNNVGIPGEPFIGDDEAIATVPFVDLGGPVEHISHGTFHSCALMQSGSVRCWGDGLNGRLGNLSTETFGDDEPPFAAGSVNLEGKRAVQVCAGGFRSHAVTEDGALYSWGAGVAGLLGLGSVDDIGDNEPPQRVNIEPVESVACGGATCAILQGGAGVKCWGSNTNGTVGSGTPNDIVGDEPSEVPAMLDPIDLGL